MLIHIIFPKKHNAKNQNIQKAKKRKRNDDPQNNIARKYSLRSRVEEEKTISTTQITEDRNTRKRKRNDVNSDMRKSKSTKLQLQERLQNETPNREYIVNELVLATVPGFAPWPARILNINGQTISVEFFGTGQM